MPLHVIHFNLQMNLKECLMLLIYLYWLKVSYRKIAQPMSEAAEKCINLFHIEIKISFLIHQLFKLLKKKKIDTATLVCP